jgi:hypothetical protein
MSEGDDKKQEGTPDAYAPHLVVTGRYVLTITGIDDPEGKCLVMVNGRPIGGVAELEYTIIFGTPRITLYQKYIPRDDRPRTCVARFVRGTLVEERGAALTYADVEHTKVVG